MRRNIWINAQDRERLDALIGELEVAPDKRDLAHIAELREELERAKVIQDVKKTPPDVITMRSEVRLRNEATNATLDCRLVYPDEADAATQQISVLAPLGTAMIGERVGKSFKAHLPKGDVRFTVEELLYQPEAAGDYHL